MAFGMMTQKWGIFQRDFCCGLDKAGLVVETMARLHNYCIDQRVYSTNASTGNAVQEDYTHPHPFQELDPRSTDGDPVLPCDIQGYSWTHRPTCCCLGLGKA